MNVELPELYLDLDEEYEVCQATTPLTFAHLTLPNIFFAYFHE